MAPPLVSCIIPTTKQAEYLLGAIQTFLVQDYVNCELIIVSDRSYDIKNIVPDHPLISYYYISSSTSISVKRDFACSKAFGTLIVHWDEDGWRSKDWITKQVSYLLSYQGDICGLRNLNYRATTTEVSNSLSEDQKRHENFIQIPTMAYLKSFWDKHPFIKQLNLKIEYYNVPKGAKLIIHNEFKSFISY